MLIIKSSINSLVATSTRGKRWAPAVYAGARVLSFGPALQGMVFEPLPDGPGRGDGLAAVVVARLHRAHRVVDLEKALHHIFRPSAHQAPHTEMERVRARNGDP